MDCAKCIGLLFLILSIGVILALLVILLRKRKEDPTALQITAILLFMLGFLVNVLLSAFKYTESLWVVIFIFTASIFYGSVMFSFGEISWRTLLKEGLPYLKQKLLKLKQKKSFSFEETQFMITYFAGVFAGAGVIAFVVPAGTHKIFLAGNSVLFLFMNLLSGYYPYCLAKYQGKEKGRRQKRYQRPVRNRRRFQR